MEIDVFYLAKMVAAAVGLILAFLGVAALLFCLVFFLYLFFTNTVVWRHWASDRVMVRYNFSEETEYDQPGSLFQ